MKAIVFDIDGVLADISHRLHYILKANKKERDYEKFYACLNDDLPIPQGILLAKILKGYVESVTDESFVFVYLSGRPERTREATKQWLDTHVGFSETDILYLRRNRDWRKAEAYKLEMLQRLQAKGIEPWLIFDDSERICKELRKNGFVCYQTQEYINA